jgi:hypothetical protein
MLEKEPVGMYEGIQLDLKQQENYETAHRLAVSRFAELDFRLQCQKAGAELVGNGSTLQARLRFLDRTLLVSHPSGEIVTENGEDVPLWEKIITLHYLIHAQGTSPSGELVTYNDIPDGRLYYPNFVKRTSDILLQAYGPKPEALIQAALKLGGIERPGLVDGAVTIPALPRVAYVFIIWKGDAEFDPQINVVFDRNISDYLPAEDITVLASMIAVKLMKAGK